MPKSLPRKLRRLRTHDAGSSDELSGDAELSLPEDALFSDVAYELMG